MIPGTAPPQIILLSDFTTQTRRGLRGHRETFGDNGYVYYLDCGDSIANVWTYAQTHQTAHIKRAVFYLSIIAQQSHLKEERQNSVSYEET